MKDTEPAKERLMNNPSSPPVTTIPQHVIARLEAKVEDCGVGTVPRSAVMGFCERQVEHGMDVETVGELIAPFLDGYEAAQAAQAAI